MEETSCTCDPCTCTAENNCGCTCWEENLDKLKATTDNEEFNNFFNYLLENARSSRENPRRNLVMQRNDDGIFEERVSPQEWLRRVSSTPKEEN